MAINKTVRDITIGDKRADVLGLESQDAFVLSNEKMFDDIGNNLISDINTVVDEINNESSYINSNANSAINAQVQSSKSESNAKQSESNAKADADRAESVVIPTEATYNYSDIDKKVYEAVPYAQHGLIPNDGTNEIRPQDFFVEVNVADKLRLSDKAKQYKVRFTDGIYDMNQDDFALLKAPFSQGSTDELLNDKDNGLTTQTDHSKGDIVVCGNELVTNGGFDENIDGWTDASTGTGTIDWENGNAKLTAQDSSNRGVIIQDTRTIVGEEYVITVEVSSLGASTQLNIDNNGLTNDTLPIGVSTYIYIATDTLTRVNINTYTNGYSLIDNISVKLKDQSYIATRDTADMYDVSVLPNISFTMNTNDIVRFETGFDSMPDNSFGVWLGDDFTGTVNGDYTISGNNWKSLGTSTNMSLQNPYFKPIPYVTKQAALLIEKTSQGAILNTVKPLVNMYGEESVETYESDIFSELGYSQKADRVFTDGSSEFILLGLKGYLNGGAFHPWFNEFGTRSWSRLTPDNNSAYQWYRADGMGSLSDSVYDSFVFDLLISTHIGTIEGGVSNNRPDSKFYDKTYINGQGGLICFSIPNANKPTYKHQEEVRRNLVDGYVENGVEIMYMGNMLISGGSDSAFSKLYISSGKDDYILKVGGVSLEPKKGYEVKIESVIEGNYESTTLEYKSNTKWKRKENSTTTEANYGLPWSSGITSVIVSAKSPYLATMGTTTHTDIIGDPSPYNSSDATYIANDGNTDTDVTDMPTNTLVWDANTSTMWKTKVDTIDLTDSTPSVAIEEGDNWTEIKKGYPQKLRSLLASGKGVGFMNSLLVSDNGDNLIPDGTSKEYKLSKKAINSDASFSRYSQDGVIWITTTMDNFYKIGNKLSRDYTDNGAIGDIEGIVRLVSYQSQNQPAISIQSPKPIQTVDRDLIASNHHSVYAYNGLTYAASGKVATGSSVEAKGVDDVVLDFDYTTLDKGVRTTDLKAGDKILIANIVGDEKLGEIYIAVDGFSDYALDSYPYWGAGSFTEISSSPTHKTLTLDNQSIVASKALLTQSSNATQVFTQEMVYDATNSDWGDSNQFDQLTSGTTPNLDGVDVQTKVLYKASSISMGDK